MDDATRFTIEKIDAKIASITEGIRRTILGTGTMTKEINRIIVETVTKDYNDIQELLKIRTKLLES